jgi:hypothetical protein
LKTLKKAWDALGIHLETVPCAEGAHNTWVGLGDAPERNELGEELFKAGRRNDLEKPCGLITRVPERVPLVAGLEDRVTRPAEHNFVPKQRADAPLYDVAVFVLTRVTVEGRREGMRGHGMFDQREPAAGLAAVNHEPHANASKEACLAVLRS